VVDTFCSINRNFVHFLKCKKAAVPVRKAAFYGDKTDTGYIGPASVASVPFSNTEGPAVSGKTLCAIAQAADSWESL